MNAENANAPSSKAVMGDAKPGANADAGASKGAEGSDNAGTKQLEKMKQQLAKIKKKLKELREIERTLTTSLALAPASTDGTSGNAYTAFIADLAAKERVLLRLYAAGGETGTSRRAYDRRGGELREVLKDVSYKQVLHNVFIRSDASRRWPKNKCFRYNLYKKRQEKRR